MFQEMIKGVDDIENREHVEIIFDEALELLTHAGTV